MFERHMFDFRVSISVRDRVDGNVPEDGVGDITCVRAATNQSGSHRLGVMIGETLQVLDDYLPGRYPELLAIIVSSAVEEMPIDEMVLPDRQKSVEAFLKAAQDVLSAYARPQTEDKS